MKTRWIFKQKGVTLIELLVALVICAVVIGAIYRLFIVQTRAYTVQDQAVEIQQTVRSAMEILLRDLRMTGYDDDNTASTVTIPTPIVTPVQESDITVSYEYYDSTLAQYQRHTVRYWRDAGTSRLFRQRTINAVAETAEALLENVDALIFTYGVDTNEDGNMDDQNGNGTIDDDDWVSAASVGISKVIAVRVELEARPTPVNPDVPQMVRPRKLTSAVTLRNVMMR